MERLLVECAVRALLIAAVTGTALWAMRIKDAAARHLAWSGVVLVMLALPLWIAWGPRISLVLLPRSNPQPEIIRNAPAERLAPAVLQTNEDLPVVPVSAASTQRTQAPLSFLNLIWVIYLLGAAVLLLRLGTGIVGAYLLRRGAWVDDGKFISSDCRSPITIGWLRAVTILPEEWVEWPRTKLDAVLIHESEHVRRHDPLFQWLALVNRAVFWFHPLAWWLERRLAALSEEACDTAVLERGHDPRDYSEYLLDLARSVTPGDGRVRVLGMAMPGQYLPQRIHKILLGVRLQKISRLRMFCTIAVCALLAVPVAAGTFARVGRMPVIVPAAPPVPAETLVSETRPIAPAPVLVQQTPIAPPAAPARPEFAVASIKVVAPGTSYPGPIGIGCRGIDAAQRMITALLVGFDTDLSVPQGRCVARAASVSTLVSFAYGNPRRVTGGPDWIQPARRRTLSRDNTITFVDETVFQIEAAADNPATATLAQLKQMFQAMLADRFKLKVHREMEEAPGFALVVGRNGPKLKAASGPEELPAQIFDDKGRIVLRGKSTLDKLARSLVTLRAPVVDKTGLPGIYEYEILAPRPPQPPPAAGGPPADPGAGRGGGPFTPPDMSGLWSNALEEQLGLRLQPEKSLPAEIVVIDQVEKPAEN